MRKNEPTTKLSKKQEIWMKKQKLYTTHPIYKNNLVREICNNFDGKVIEVDGKRLTYS